MSTKTPAEKPIFAVPAYEYDGELYPTSYAAEKARVAKQLGRIFSYIPDKGFVANMVIADVRNTYVEDLIKNHREVVEILSKLAAAEVVVEAVQVERV